MSGTEDRDDIILNRFRRNLLSWGEVNIRSYPWRYISNPYVVIVSEFMLHRTQVSQVLPVFSHFILKYPTLEKFADGYKEEIRLILDPLGLRWRTDFMIAALNKLWSTYGEVPTNYSGLLDISGIGPYIAGATICFSTNSPVPLIDTNTLRVTGRVFGLDLAGEARRRKSVVNTISKTIDHQRPRDFYYSMIDLAHSLCHPKNPECNNCPLENVPCVFAKTNKK